MEPRSGGGRGGGGDLISSLIKKCLDINCTYACFS